MRILAPRRRMLALPVAIVAAFALLLQVVAAPGISAGPPDALLGRGSICHAITSDAGEHAPQPLSGHDCDHCLLCQAGAVAILLPPSPRLPVPAVTAAAAARLPADRPRGAARPAYASRAPPAIG
jgi:hypothetical protein